MTKIKALNKENILKGKEDTWNDITRLCFRRTVLVGYPCWEITKELGF